MLESPSLSLFHYSSSKIECGRLASGSVSHTPAVSWTDVGQ
ncbi:Protein of unknown function [Pyronema omphalodes CBS 100304]|uniref:Uncharacterized protein n=1 Tax=Pyronema omphalodes (strain CBS 100304) TaxID=1076935 RepID=U4LEF1_PYROM|nr:Protein of unknown function [Pyronema omphalodes CBS 100304]